MLAILETPIVDALGRTMWPKNAAALLWARRREKYGPTGMSPEALAREQRRASTMVLCRWSGTHCGRGHKFTQDNTYVKPSGKRTCRACRQLRTGRQRGAALRAAHLARLRRDLIVTHPDTGGSQARFRSALRAYRAALKVRGE